MKHGLIVLAHGNIPDLVDVLEQFGPGFEAYVHVDKKARIPTNDLDFLRSRPMVKMVSRRYRVNWGGLNVVKAILHLTRSAIKDTELSYLHMITGTDRIIVTPSKFHAFFEDNAGREFLLHFPLPTEYWPNGGTDRLTRYDPLDLFNVRTPSGKKIRNFLLHVQQRLGITRSIPKHFPALFGGSMSWSLSRELLAYVVAQLDRDPKYLQRLAHTFCPDEIALQTVIMNSPFAARVENNNLRYIDWTRKKTAHPYVLDEANLAPMLASGMLFARKIDRPMSDQLIERLREEIREPDSRHH
jgi:hypothetical protein